MSDIFGASLNLYTASCGSTPKCEVYIAAMPGGKALKRGLIRKHSHQRALAGQIAPGTAQRCSDRTILGLPDILGDQFPRYISPDRLPEHPPAATASGPFLGLPVWRTPRDRRKSLCARGVADVVGAVTDV